MEKHIIYFVRHGESVGNEKKICLGGQDELHGEGLKQAGLLGEHLNEVQFTRVISSDFSRAHDTAKIVMSKSKYPKPVETDQRLQEINLGTFEGKSFRESIEELTKVSGPNESWEIPDGETISQLNARFDSFFQEYMKEFDQTHEAQTVLFCSHAFFLRRIFLCLKSSNYLEVENFDESCNKLMRNTSYMKVSVERLQNFDQSESNEKRKVKFLSVHTVQHLPASEHLGIFPESVTRATGLKYYDCVQS